MTSLGLPSLSKGLNPYKACIYGLCRDFLDGDGYYLGTKTIYFFLGKRKIFPRIAH